MFYENVRHGIFLSRPNRFLAHVELDGKREVCHVKNTGRCRELLVPGAQVFVQYRDGAKRKTSYDLIAVNKGGRLINMDSQAPNPVFAEWVRRSGYFQDVTRVRPEFAYGNARLDFLIEAGGRRILAEVKGVTLEENGVALFPDAPTERGVKHLRTLQEGLADGYDAYAVFIIQMKNVGHFMPNDQTHKAFGDALRMACERGVKLLALDCAVTETSITATGFVDIRL